MRRWLAAAVVGVVFAAVADASPLPGNGVAQAPALTAAARGTSAAQTSAAAGRVLVVPFENVNREGRLYWLTEASAILVTQNLTAAGQTVITRDERLRAFERLQLPPVASLSEATVIRVGQLVGATIIVLGAFSVEGDDLEVKARTLRLDTGHVTADLVQRGRLDGLFSIFDLLSEGLAGRRASGRVARESLPVFENYVKGLLAETPARQVRFLEAALRLSPRFDEARIALWQVYSAQGDHARAATAALAVPADSPLGRRARFLAALSRIRLHQYEEAFQGLKALLDEAPAASVYNNMGVVQLRRGPTPQGGPTYYFNRAAEGEADPDYAFNLGYAYWFSHDAKAASYWLREAVRRNPADGDAHYVLGVALQATGAQVEGDREKDLARQLSSKYAEWERRPATGDPVPKGLERLREELDRPRLSLVDATLGPGERKDQEQIAAYHLERGRRLFEQQHDGEAVDELNRSLYILPYQADAHLLLGRIHLRAGRLTEAAEELKISLWSQETVAAHVALGEVYLQSKDSALASSEADKALALNPQSPEAKALKEKTGK